MDINSKQIEKIISELAVKYKLHKIDVRIMIMSEFEAVKETMKKVDSYNNHFPYIRLPFIGVFKVKKGKRKFFIEKSKKLIDDVHSQGQ